MAGREQLVAALGGKLPYGNAQPWPQAQQSVMGGQPQPQPQPLTQFGLIESQLPDSASRQRFLDFIGRRNDQQQQEFDRPRSEQLNDYLMQTVRGGNPHKVGLWNSLMRAVGGGLEPQDRINEVFHTMSGRLK